MITRSDGMSFDLLLVDRPLPYPNECSAPTRKISVCFRYSHVSQPKMTNAFSFLNWHPDEGPYAELTLCSAAR